MKKKIKWILGGIVSLMLVVYLSGFIYFQFFFHLNLFEEGPIKEVNYYGWELLEEGMTKAEVVKLLGEPESKFERVEAEQNSLGRAILEIWEYNWTIGISWWGEVHSKSYIVRFESDDTLASWREPLKAEQ